MAKRRRRKGPAPVIELRKHFPDNRQWNPSELLREMLKAIESGEIKPKNLMVFFLNEGEDADYPESWTANMTRIERVALSAYEADRALRAWKDAQ